MNRSEDDIIEVVDAHIHLWNLDENYYPWLSDGDRPSVVSDYSSLRRNYLVTDLLADVATVAPPLRIVAAVHIQAEHDPSDHVRETRWLQGVADSAASHGVPQAIVANADLAAADAQQVLEAHCAFANTRGIRQALHRRLDATPAYDPLHDDAFQRNFDLLRRFGLSFDLQYFQQQGPAVLALVRDHPDVQFILTHAGMRLSNRPEEVQAWQHNLRALAREPNVATKISGFGMYDGQWNAATIEPLVLRLLEWFTPARCMMASNFPVERIHRRYADVWRDYLTCLRGCTDDERRALFAGNARRIYRLDAGADSASHAISSGT